MLRGQIHTVIAPTASVPRERRHRLGEPLHPSVFLSLLLNPPRAARTSVGRRNRPRTRWPRRSPATAPSRYPSPKRASARGLETSSSSWVGYPAESRSTTPPRSAAGSARRRAPPRSSGCSPRTTTSATASPTPAREMRRAAWRTRSGRCGAACSFRRPRSGRGGVRRQAALGTPGTLGGQGPLPQGGNRVGPARRGPLPAAAVPHQMRGVAHAQVRQAGLLQGGQRVPLLS